MGFGGCNGNLTFLILILLLCSGGNGSNNDYNCGCCNG
jgi:hypothetical protein